MDNECGNIYMKSITHHLNLPSFLDVRSINNWKLSDTVSFALSKNLSKKFDKKLTHRLTL